MPDSVPHQLNGAVILCTTQIPIGPPFCVPRTQNTYPQWMDFPNPQGSTWTGLNSSNSTKVEILYNSPAISPIVQNTPKNPTSPKSRNRTQSVIIPNPTHKLILLLSASRLLPSSLCSPPSAFVSLLSRLPPSAFCSLPTATRYHSLSFVV